MTPTIAKIVLELRESDASYYKDGTSTLTDKEYDTKKDFVRKLDPTNPYLLEIGHERAELVTEWAKVKHEYPLGSLNKCNTVAEFKSWWDGLSVLIEHKFDGLSIALTYEEGKLIKAVTRGNGEEGDDILANVVKMQGVRKEIPFKDKLVIRGEILLKHSDWLKMPVEDRGKNPRNTASGAAKELNGSKCKYLTVMIYTVLNSKNESELEDLNLLKKLGFDPIGYIHLHDILEIEKMYEDTTKLRTELDFDIDGLVIKPVIKKKDEWKFPKFQIAWKFPHPSTSSYLRKVIWQVSGDRISPVAEFDPVELDGVTINRASLHNMDYIKALNIKIGDKIEITRRNQVIPQVESVLEHLGTEDIEQPDSCPCCGGAVGFDTNVNEVEMAWLVCQNPHCSAKVIKNIIKWLEVHDTKGVAEKTVEMLYENGIISSLPDFLKLGNPPIIKEKAIIGIEGMGERSFQILKEQIQKTLDCDLILFFAGLNASGFGKRMWERIVKYIQIDKDVVTKEDVIEFIKLPYAKGLGHIEGFAETSTLELQRYMDSHFFYIEKMLEVVKVRDYSKPSLTSETLKGKSFCFTGELDSMGRKEAQDAVLRNGGDVKSSVTKGLTYLVTNDTTSGSSKNKKAQQVGTAIISEAEFLTLIK